MKQSTEQRTHGFLWSLANRNGQTEASTSSIWLEFLERGNPQIEAGKIIAMEPFLGRLRASITRMESRLSEQPKRSTRKA
jgi:hypothetical protein